MKTIEVTSICNRRDIDFTKAQLLQDVNYPSIIYMTIPKETGKYAKFYKAVVLAENEKWNDNIPESNRLHIGDIVDISLDDVKPLPTNKLKIVFEW